MKLLVTKTLEIPWLDAILAVTQAYSKKWQVRCISIWNTSATMRPCAANNIRREEFPARQIDLCGLWNLGNLPVLTEITTEITPYRSDWKGRCHRQKMIKRFFRSDRHRRQLFCRKRECATFPRCFVRPRIDRIRKGISFSGDCRDSNAPFYPQMLHTAWLPLSWPVSRAVVAEKRLGLLFYFIRSSEALINKGKSPGSRLEIKLPSSTTAWSINSAPAFLISWIMDFHPVIFRPRITSALIKSWAAWQMTKTGLPLSTNSFANCTALSSTLSLSGE